MITLGEICNRLECDSDQLAVWVLKSREGLTTPLTEEEIVHVVNSLSPERFGMAAKIRCFDDIRNNWRKELRQLWYETNDKP